MHSVRLLALACLSQPLFAQSLIVIDDDGGPNVDFTELQPAIDAAAPGSVLFVREGVYAPFVIDTKSLDLVRADANAVVRVQGSSRIINLDALAQVRISGIEFSDVIPPLFSSGPTLDVQNCAGTVFIDRCSLMAPLIGGFFQPTDYAGLGLESCERVVLSSSASGATLFSGSGPGVDMRSSMLAVFDSSLVGGSSLANPFGEGNPGLSSLGGQVSISSSQIRGGDGEAEAFVIPTGCDGAGDGAPGLELLFGSSADLVASTLQGGSGGALSGDPGCQFAGAPSDGAPTDIDASSSLLEVSGQVARRQSFNSPLSAGTAVDIALEGAGQENAYLLISSGADLRFSPLTLAATPAAVTASVLIAYLGQLDPLGSLTAQVATPSLPAGIALVLVTQPAFVDGAFNLTLGNPLTVTLIGPGL